LYLEPTFTIPLSTITNPSKSPKDHFQKRPKMSSNTNKSTKQASSSSSRDTQPKDRSQYAQVKSMGWNSMKDFSESYGLKMQDTDDYAEAQAIAKGLQDLDQAKWEAEHKK